jgi:hypothetical protein
LGLSRFIVVFVLNLLCSGWFTLFQRLPKRFSRFLDGFFDRLFDDIIKVFTAGKTR